MSQVLLPGCKSELSVIPIEDPNGILASKSMFKLLFFPNKFENYILIITHHYQYLMFDQNFSLSNWDIFRRWLIQVNNVSTEILFDIEYPALIKKEWVTLNIELSSKFSVPEFNVLRLL